MSAWQVGDHVTIVLPERARIGRGVTRVPVNGTVVAVDPEGKPRGVRVHLDRLVNGVDNCYATHDELTTRRAPDTCGADHLSGTCESHERTAL